jgi:membrane protein YqaA with SNARE-associated domain
MKTWLVVTLILIVQELVLFNGLILETYRGVYSALIITTLFFIFTALDIFIGYFLGKYVKEHWKHGKIIQLAKKWSENFHANVGRKGRKFSLFLFGNFTFPYLAAFIAAWLEMPLDDTFIYVLLGDFLSYITGWIIAAGLTSIIPNPLYSLIGIVIISLIIIFFGAKFRGKKL